MWTNQYDLIPNLGTNFTGSNKLGTKFQYRCFLLFLLLNKVCPEFYHIQQEKDNTFIRVISCSLRPSKEPIPLQGHRVHKTKFHKDYQTKSATLPARSFSTNPDLRSSRELISSRKGFDSSDTMKLRLRSIPHATLMCSWKRTYYQKKGVDRCSRI